MMGALGAIGRAMGSAARGATKIGGGSLETTGGMFKTAEKSSSIVKPLVEVSKPDSKIIDFSSRLESKAKGGGSGPRFALESLAEGLPGEALEKDKVVKKEDEPEEEKEEEKEEAKRQNPISQGSVEAPPQPSEPVHGIISATIEEIPEALPGGKDKDIVRQAP